MHSLLRLADQKVSHAFTHHTILPTHHTILPTHHTILPTTHTHTHYTCIPTHPHTHRVVATIAAPVPLSSVSILRDGSTLLAGGTDGVCVCSLCTIIISSSIGKLYLYELRSLKTPKSVTEAHQTAVTRIAPHTPLKVNHV